MIEDDRIRKELIDEINALWANDAAPWPRTLEQKDKYISWLEKERRITAPDGCEIEKVELVDGVAVVTFKGKERRLPKSWDEFCEMYPIPYAFAKIKTDFDPSQDYLVPYYNRIVDEMEKFTRYRATAEAVLALCQLILLRNAYNGNWVPDWTSPEAKFMIYFDSNGQLTSTSCSSLADLLFFENEKLCNEFLHNFRSLIEKLKPLYGII